jgi:hypothetical protein
MDKEHIKGAADKAKRPARDAAGKMMDNKSSPARALVFAGLGGELISASREVFLPSLRP